MNYSLGSGTATAGTDYTDASGAVTFACRCSVGHGEDVHGPDPAEQRPRAEAKTIPIQLTATGADVTLDKPVVVINAHGLPYLNPNLPVAQRVADLMSRMTLADKIGQMTQAERARPDAPVRHHDLRARIAALRRRLDADAEHARRRGPT